MPDYSYHITELSELDWKKKGGPKLALFGYVLEFLHRMTSWCKHTHSAIYDAMKSYLTRVLDKKICNGYITLETGFYVINNFHYYTAKKFLVIWLVNVPGTYIMFLSKIHVKAISSSEIQDGVYRYKLPIWKLVYLFFAHRAQRAQGELLGWWGVHHASSTISLNISSQTAGPIWTKLGRNVP